MSHFTPKHSTLLSKYLHFVQKSSVESKTFLQKSLKNFLAGFQQGFICHYLKFLDTAQKYLSLTENSSPPPYLFANIMHF